MSDVNANDLRKIESIDDVLSTYQGAGADAMTGIEVELAYFDPRSPDLTPMNIAQNQIVKDKTNTECCGDFARNEPTSEMLEIGSKPDTPDHLESILQDTNCKIACLTQKAADLGLKRSYFQDLPNKTAQDLLQNVVPVDRYQAFFAPPRDDMQAIAAYFSVCKSNQVSVSYRNPDHMLANIRRLYALTPFIFMITDNGSGFDEGAAFSGHAGMKHRAALAGRGGFPPYVLTAKTGDDYIRAHIDHVMHNPLFVYYDAKGQLVRLPSGQWESFHTLRDKGLNTATNYYFAESILWPDVKIAALRDQNDQVSGHRYEARMIGVGIHQHQTALLIVAGLAFRDDFAARVDALLQSYGFDTADPDSFQAHLDAAYRNAREHGGQFLEIGYGTGQMWDFAKDFADLIEESYAGSALEPRLAPLLEICRSGNTDAKISRLLFPDLKDVLAFQQCYDPGLFDDTDQCAALLFRSGDMTEHTDRSVCSRGA